MSNYLRTTTCMSLTLPLTLWLSKLASGEWHHCSAVSVSVAVFGVAVVAAAAGDHHLSHIEQHYVVPL